MHIIQTNQTSPESKKTHYILGLFAILVIFSIILAIYYLYGQSIKKGADTQPSVSVGQPIFNPVQEQQAVGAVLSDRLRATKKIDIDSLQEITSRLTRTEEAIFHTGEVTIKHGGRATEVSYIPDATGEETSLHIVINSLKDASVTYTADFTKAQTDTMLVFLNTPYEPSQRIGLGNIEVGDLVNIYETIDILESERVGFIAIEIEKVPVP